MTKRLNHFAAAPQGMETLLNQETYLRSQFSDNHAITMTTWELVKLRVSQINQCAFCIDMHSKDALHNGEKPERLYGLIAWREIPLYSEQERSALAWTELITAGQPVSDERYQQALDNLGEQGLVDLTIAVNAINSWNRIAKAFKPEVGRYQPG